MLRAMDRLYDTGLFSGVWPRVERRGPDALDVLVVALDSRPRLGLDAAVGYEKDRGGRLWSLLECRTAALGAPLETRTGGGDDGIERWLEASLLLHGLAPLGLGWTAGLHHLDVTQPLLVTGPDDVDVQRTGGWAGLRYRRSGVIASLVGQAEAIHVEDGVSGRSWGGMLRVSSTTAATGLVGVPMELEAMLRAGVLDYAVLGGRASLRRGIGAMKAAAVLEGAATLGDPPPDELPALGDRHAMPGFRWGEGRARARVLGGVDLAWPILGNGWGRLRVRAGADQDAPDDLTRFSGWTSGAALEGIWTTPFGPVVVGYGINTRGSDRIDVGVGGWF
ncbi:MAG: hypothetical protein EXR95_01810 [Gemmatimonadetes bacterium]|nr:hypothetical protein [Gemmatimonadota bacterium]